MKTSISQTRCTHCFVLTSHFVFPWKCHQHHHWARTARIQRNPFYALLEHILRFFWIWHVTVLWLEQVLSRFHHIWSHSFRYLDDYSSRLWIILLSAWHILVMLYKQDLYMKSSLMLTFYVRSLTGSLHCTDWFDWFMFGSLCCFQFELKCFYASGGFVRELVQLWLVILLQMADHLYIFTEHFRFFQGNISLRSVDLSFNGLGKEGAVALGQALRDNSVLEELNVRYEPLSSLRIR